MNHFAQASAPATSGNIGPGFDVIALALELRCSVTATIADQWSVDHVGRYQLPTGDRDFILEAAQDAVGIENPLALVVENDIPISRGLGSSAAALVAGRAAALRAVGKPTDLDQIFAATAKAEGHGDNAAAAVFGGLIAVNQAGPIALPIALVWRVVVAIPEFELATNAARTILSPEIDRSTVVRSLARIISLTEGLRRGDASILAQAGGDELHEAQRASLNPVADELIKTAKAAGASHAAWSGAGPTVIAICESRVVEQVRDALQDAMPNCEARILEIATTGLI